MRLVRAKLFIDEHYASDIDLDNIADEASFSKYHFIRLFRRVFGATPHQYLTSVRLFRARALLAQGVPVTDTCYSVGFDSLSSFTGLFKRAVGKTPSAFRAEALHLRADMARAPLAYIPHCFASSYGWLPGVSPENRNFQEVPLAAAPLL
jgi:AraC-like DNA-binding protein